jgi:hypothetical protein
MWGVNELLLQRIVDALLYLLRSGRQGLPTNHRLGSRLVAYRINPEFRTPHRTTLKSCLETTSYASHMWQVLTMRDSYRMTVTSVIFA